MVRVSANNLVPTDDELIKLAESSFASINFTDYINPNTQSPDIIQMSIDFGPGILKVMAVLKKELFVESVRDFYNNTCSGLRQYTVIRKIEVMECSIMTPFKIMNISGYRLLASFYELNNDYGT